MVVDDAGINHVHGFRVHNCVCLSQWCYSLILYWFRARLPLFRLGTKLHWLVCFVACLLSSLRLGLSSGWTECYGDLAPFDLGRFRTLSVSLPVCSWDGIAFIAATACVAASSLRSCIEQRIRGRVNVNFWRSSLVQSQFVKLEKGFKVCSEKLVAP